MDSSSRNISNIAHAHSDGTHIHTIALSLSLSHSPVAETGTQVPRQVLGNPIDPWSLRRPSITSSAKRERETSLPKRTTNATSTERHHVDAKRGLKRGKLFLILCAKRCSSARLQTNGEQWWWWHPLAAEMANRHPCCGKWLPSRV